MKLFLYYFTLLFISSVINAQNNQANITIRVFSESLNLTDTIYITGNNETFGNWQPDLITIERQENYWEKTFSFPIDMQLEFKFTKGSWESEALDENGNIPGNHNVRVKQDTTLIYNIDLWNDGNAEAGFVGQVTGNVKYHKEMLYEGLRPRDIIVWLPPGYDENIEKQYPVLYMHDGQNIFDPNTSFTKIDWQLDETADSLIRKGNIEPMIIVGICNTIDRSEEYSPTPKGQKYMEFILAKLKPFIDSTYRTLPDRQNTSVGGSSIGGLISFMLVWNYPEYFSKAACFSPAFKYTDFDYTTNVKNYSGVKKEIKFYIDNGGIGLESELQPGVNLMVDALREKGYKLNEDLFVRIEKNAEHNEAAWAKRVHLPLELFYSIKSTIQKKESSLNSIKPNIRNNKILNKRMRIQISTVNTLEENDFDVNLPFLLNLNYRFSNLDSLRLEEDFAISFSAEPGINIFFREFFYLPYFKIGPELRFNKNIYLDIHGGFFIFYTLLTNPKPFYGSEIGYILNDSQDYSIEFELGFNGIHPFYLYYFSVAYSF